MEIVVPYHPVSTCCAKGLNPKAFGLCPKDNIKESKFRSLKYLVDDDYTCHLTEFRFKCKEEPKCDKTCETTSDETTCETSSVSSSSSADFCDSGPPAWISTEGTQITKPCCK